MQNSFNFLPESPPGMLIIQPETEKLNRTRGSKMDGN